MKLFHGIENNTNLCYYGQVIRNFSVVSILSYQIQFFTIDHYTNFVESTPESSFLIFFFAKDLKGFPIQTVIIKYVFFVSINTTKNNNNYSNNN